MKKLTKRTISMLMSLVMLLLTIEGVQLSASAATLSQSISWAESKVGYRVGAGQCTDLVTAYWNYLGYNTYCNSGYKYPLGQGSLPPGSKMIVYKSGVTAQAGDVAVYSKGWNGGSYGHVAIVTSATSSNITVVEQYGSTDKLTHKNTVGYSRGSGYVLYGFIRHAGSSSNSGSSSGGSSGGTSSTTPTPAKPSLALSTTNVSLNMDGTKTASVKCTANNLSNNSYGTRYTLSNSNIKCSWSSWSGNSCNLNITALATGSTTITIELYNTKDNSVYDKKTVNASVTSNTYTISFNANGGIGAPSSISFKNNQIITIPSTTPKSNTSYTVTFDANGGTLNDVSSKSFPMVFDYWYDSNGNKYYPGSSYQFTSSKSLTAHYTYSSLSIKDPKKDNYYFVGWYDSSNRSNSGPTGNLYVRTSKINKNITLYAMWSQSSSIIFGDVNRDGKLNDTDAIVLHQYSIGTVSALKPDVLEFIGDVNCDGKISYCTTCTDKDTICCDTRAVLSVCRFNTLNYYELPVLRYFTGFTVSSCKKSYNYGEAFDYDSVVLQANYSNSNVHHYISDDLVVTGYDPFTSGTQLVTVKFYQYQASVNVTVGAAPTTISYNTSAGVGGSTQTLKGATYTHTHTPVTQPAVAPTCTTSGLTEGSYCSTCGTVIQAQEYLGPIGHSYTISIKRATCVSDGTETATCFLCGETKKELILSEGHNYQATIVKPTCTSKGYTEYLCSSCGDSFNDCYVSASGHTTTTDTIKATLSDDGIAETRCTVCGELTSSKAIAKPSTIKLSANSYIYNGKNKKPTVTVKDSKGNTISSSNYIVTYASGRKDVGKYKVTVKFTGAYSGTSDLYFTIHPKNTSIKKLTAGKKKFTVKLKKYTTQTTGYQIQYATNSSFKSAKTITIKNTTTSKTISKLAGKKKYYVRVRTYKTVNGIKYYSSWSKAKTITTKK